MAISDLEKVNILVVDDHPENCMALDAMLARPDYNIVTAYSGDEALKKILRNDFAVIILDVLMPEMDGFETAQLIRQREASRHIPIVFLTASGADMGLIYRAYAVGAVDYLVKPVNSDIVKSKVGVFVDLYRKSQKIAHQERALREAELRRSEAALRESEAQYEATFNDAAVGIAHTGTDGRWIRVNRRFCDIVGYDKDEIDKLRLQDITHPDDVADSVAALRDMLCGTVNAYRCEKRYLHKSGQPVWVNQTVSILRDRSGKLKHFITVIEDITERKRMEERQRFLATASERLLSSLDYRAILENVTQLAIPLLGDWCAIQILESDGLPAYEAVAHVDGKMAARLLELAPDPGSAAKYGVGDVLKSGRATIWADISDASLKSKLPDEASRKTLIAAGFGCVTTAPLAARGQVFGAITVVRARSAAKRQAQGDLAVVEDLAHRVAFAVDNARLYSEAQAAISARDEFLSIASHELRTPLTPLQIQLQWLLSPQKIEQISAERLKSTIQRTERQVQRLAALIDNLLDVSRISAGRLRLEREDFDLCELVREVVTRFSEEAQRAKCAIDIDAPTAVSGRWDRLRVEQVMTNLLINAIKYGDGKPVEVSVRRDNERARLIVKDGGIGIEPEKLSRIFARFERAVSSRSYGGLGLGLYIARQIVDAHGGSIGVTSEPGNGSTFVVDLPLDVVEALPAPSAESPRSETLVGSGATSDPISSLQYATRSARGA